jgi:hypothetical protein
VEKIDVGQPEQIIPGAGHHAPGEAGEGYPVDASRLEYHQDCEDSEQGEKEQGANRAQRDDTEHLTRDGQQRRTDEEPGTGRSEPDSVSFP